MWRSAVVCAVAMDTKTDLFNFWLFFLLSPSPAHTHTHTRSHFSSIHCVLIQHGDSLSNKKPLHLPFSGTFQQAGFCNIQVGKIRITDLKKLPPTITELGCNCCPLSSSEQRLGLVRLKGPLSLLLFFLLDPFWPLCFHRVKAPILLRSLSIQGSALASQRSCARGSQRFGIKAYSWLSKISQSTTFTNKKINIFIYIYI